MHNNLGTFLQNKKLMMEASTEHLEFVSLTESLNGSILSTWARLQKTTKHIWLSQDSPTISRNIETLLHI